MNITIKNELFEFKKYHKNIYNVYFHIFCGFVFMTFIFLLSKNYSNILLLIYSLFIFFTINNFIISLTIFLIIYVLIYLVKKYKFKLKTIFILFLAFYLLPDLSHYLTNEPSVLNLQNISILSIFINIFYLLPFSIMCLPNSK